VGRISWGSVRAGAALSLAVILVTMVLFELVDASVGIGRGSNWVFLFYALALIGLVAGGRRAARRRPDAPLLHGVLAVLAAYGVVAVIGLVLRVTTDRDIDPVALAFNALMAASAGILGTVLAERHTTA
jgi:hypothetical protein